MFGLLAVCAVVPNVDILTTITEDIQQVVEEQVQQEELQEVQEDTQEGSSENLYAITNEIEKHMLNEILVHNGYSYGAAIQDYVNYAYHLGGMEFVKLIECENGRWDPQRVSKTNDRGLCQLNYKYNKKFINSPDFADPYKQLDYCYEKYKVNPKLRYGPSRMIEGKKCSDYVSDRFSFLITYNNKIIAKNIK